MMDGRYVVLKEGTETPLWCGHLLNGRVDAYDPFYQHMRPTIPVFGMTLQPLDGTRRPLRTISAMCRVHAATIDHVQPEGAVRLLGYSWGGQIAHQTAAELISMGREVSCVGLVDTWHPNERRRSDRAKQVATDFRQGKETGSSSLIGRFVEKMRKAPGRAWYYTKLAVVAPLNLPHNDEMERRRFVRIGLATRETHTLAPLDVPVTFFQVDRVDFAGPPDTASSWVATDDANVVSISGAHRGPRSAMFEPKVGETADAVMKALDQAEMR